MRYLWLAIALSAAPAAAAAPSNLWLYGTWRLLTDEDSKPGEEHRDIMTFGRDTYVSHGVDCSVRSESPMHLHGEDVYVTVEWPKGPIAIIFRPTADRTRLVFTSPRTRNNAVYEKLAENPCD